MVDVKRKEGREEHQRDSGSRKNVWDKEGNDDEARVDCSLIVALQDAVIREGEEFPRAKHGRPRAKIPTGERPKNFESNPPSNEAKEIFTCSNVPIHHK